MEERILAEAFARLPGQKDRWVVEDYEDDKDGWYSGGYGLGFKSGQESEAGDCGMRPEVRGGK